jgi:hypothetical protein
MAETPAGRIRDFGVGTVATRVIIHFLGFREVAAAEVGKAGY